MTLTASIQVFLDAPPTPVAQRPANASQVAEPAAREDFRQHYQGSLNRQQTQHSSSADANSSRSNTEASSQSVRRAETTSTPPPPTSARTESGNSLPPEGESLPLPAKVAEVLDQLPEDQRQAFLDQLTQWFKQLTETQQALLAEGQWDELPEDLAAGLQDLLAQWQALLAEQNLELDQTDSLAALQALLQQLAVAHEARPDWARLAYDAGKGELRRLSGDSIPAGPRTEAGLAEREGGRGLNLTERADSLSTRQETTSSREGVADRLESLVSRLTRGDASAQSTNLGRSLESLQQLMNAASQGLQSSSQVTQSVAARQALGAPGMPFMAQITAQANAEALANRIQMMQARGMQIAEMRLDPPDLGQLRVQIRMQGEQASVIFHTPNPHARELLEQAIPRLREMMENGGLMLADAQVSDEGQGEGEGGSGDAPGFAGQSGEVVEDDELAQTQVTLLDQPLSLIDYYA